MLNQIPSQNDKDKTMRTYETMEAAVAEFKLIYGEAFAAPVEIRVLQDGVYWLQTESGEVLLKTPAALG